MYAPSFGEVFSPRLLIVRIQLAYTPSKSLCQCTLKSHGPARLMRVPAIVHTQHNTLYWETGSRLLARANRATLAAQAEQGSE